MTQSKYAKTPMFHDPGSGKRRADHPRSVFDIPLEGIQPPCTHLQGCCTAPASTLYVADMPLPTCGIGKLVTPTIFWVDMNLWSGQRSHLEIAVYVPEHIDRRLEQHSSRLRLEDRGHALTHLDNGQFFSRLGEKLVPT